MPTIKTNDRITLALSVKNREKSAAWFNEHLGFEVLFSADAAGWTEIATNTPGVSIGLGDTEKQKPGNCVPVFGVEDVASARAALEAKDVSFDGETLTIEGMVSVATFYDPDGNALMIAQDLSEG